MFWIKSLSSKAFVMRAYNQTNNAFVSCFLFGQVSKVGEGSPPVCFVSQPWFVELLLTGQG
jgi:hypothetical protein